MCPVGLPITLKYRRRGLQVKESSVRKHFTVPVKWQGPRCVNSVLYIPLTFQTVFKSVFLE